MDNSQFISDLESGQLASVSWLIPPIGYNDHPPQSMCAGENWTVDTLNALKRSRYWKTSAEASPMFDAFDFDQRPAPPLFLKQRACP